MNKRKYFILFALMLATNMFAQVEKIVGEWTTIDDKSGKAVSVVKIYKEKDLYYGKIIKLISPDANPKSLGEMVIRDMKEKKGYLRFHIVKPAANLNPILKNG